MKWLGFSSSGVEVKLKMVADKDIYIFLQGQTEQSIGVESDFGMQVSRCNDENSNNDRHWLNFIYHEAKNLWYRPLAALRIGSLLPYFPDLIFKEEDAGNLEISFSSNSGTLTNTKAEPNDKQIGRLSGSDISASSISGSNTGDKNDDARDMGSKPTSNSGAFIKGRANEQIGLFGEGIQSVGRATNGSISADSINESGANGNGQKRNNGSIDITRNELESSIKEIGRGSNKNWQNKNIYPISSSQTKNERIQANIRAIELAVNKVGDELNEDEKGIVAKFSGWGGLSEEVVRGNILEAVSNYLDPNELSTIKSSALYGYFTGDDLIKSIWKLLERGGFKGGRIIESSCGIGKFISNRLPMYDESQHFTGVEIDKISGQIATLLHPSANIFVSPFEKVYANRLKDDSFDLSIGNIPFGEQTIIDEDGE
jgi:hypothetical protein